MKEWNILLFSLSGFFTGFLINRFTQKRTGSQPPVLFLPFLCLLFAFLCRFHPWTDNIFILSLLMAATVDHFSGEIPDRCSLMILLSSLSHCFSVKGMMAMSWMIPLAQLNLLGWGDVKLMMAAGSYLGPFSIFSAMILACWSALPYCLCRKKRRKHIPMAPWLAAGCIVSLFCDDLLFSLFILHRIPF